MPLILVQRAIEQSRSRQPLVRAVALLYGARVLSVIDKEAAKRAFAEGVTTAESLPLDARQLHFLLEDAVRLGTMADPLAAVTLFRRLPPAERYIGRSSTGAMLVQSLARSGEFQTAIELLEDLNCETGGAAAVVHFASDPALQRRAMLAARERWRALRSRSEITTPFAQRDFYHLFSQYWRKLEPTDQESWLDEILLALDTDPDHPTSAGFGERVRLHSTRDVHLFEILNVLRTLKPPEQVDAILRVHPDVADAARLYPLGLESLQAQQPPVPEGGQRPSGIGYSSSGSGSDHRFMMAAHYSDPAVVQRLLAEAHQLHQEDTDPNDPNLAPRVFWPSCHAYKVAMYWAGKRLGKDAEPLLTEIPDEDFALLASIELEAGALGLPQHSGLRMEHHPKRTPYST
jgi:hypothetical protein